MINGDVVMLVYYDGDGNDGVLTVVDDGDDGSCGDGVLMAVVVMLTI